MNETSRVEIAAANVRSLCWDGDELVDWASGGQRYRMNGSLVPHYVSYGYRFDWAVNSQDGQYAVICERYGTKGLLLKNGEILRELNRSFYHADVFEYPVAFAILPDGLSVIVHCPDDYNRLEIEDAETGERLTKRDGKADDFFHSRLQVSPDGQTLMSAGWIWHPVDAVALYNLEKSLANPTMLDKEGISYPADFDADIEANNTAFLDNDRILIASSDYFYEPSAENKPATFGYRNSRIGAYNFREQIMEILTPISEPAGPLMPLGKFVVGFYKHPKLINIETGAISLHWPDLLTGEQQSSIYLYQTESPLPPLALDTENQRFAVADKNKITIITLG